MCQAIELKKEKGSFSATIGLNTYIVKILAIIECDIKYMYL